MGARPQSQHRQQLSLLSIPSGPSYQVQSQHPLYSPALQTAIHQGFPSAFPPPPLLQTPIQPSFFPLPGVPLHQGHRAQASVALAAAGIHPPPGIPLTPLAQSQFAPPAFNGPQFPPFQRNRRQPSVSTGGPPKAQLGGAGKNYRPPEPTAVALANVTTQNQKSKKAIVNLPKETVSGVDGEPPTRTSIARTPIPLHLVHPQRSISPPDVFSAVIYPEDSLRINLPDTIDVFLPGKSAWEAVRRNFIEEKLEKLGVEKGSGSHSTIPHIHAPHARAASISSPADPALLYFKLNKLQEAQNSQSHSISVSPQLPQYASSDTTTPPPIIQPSAPAPASLLPLRHGHSLSLAAPPFMPSRPYVVFNASTAYNPLGPGSSLESDAVRSPETQSDPGAPTDQSLAPPAMPARADSRPDFIRGFGLDIPEETEEEMQQNQNVPDGQEEQEQEEHALVEASHVALAGSDDTMDMELDVDEADAEVGSITTAAHSRIHSRHVSRLSAALPPSGHESDAEVGDERNGQGERDRELEDAIGEWTGSEDMRTTTETTEDEQSIGEWSNPSDEERARQERQQRRLMRRVHHQQQQESIQVPRRIPNFPRPPANSLPLTNLLSQPRRESGEDMISNPSDDNADRSPAPLFPPSSRPPSSRLSLHDPAPAHSRTPSNNLISTPFQIPMPIPIQAPVPKRTDVLNPHAKPFVFASTSRRSGSFTQVTFGPHMQQPPQPHIVQPPPSLGHVRGASLGKSLNAGAPEFKPSAFTFTPPLDVPKFPVLQPPMDSPSLPTQSSFANVDTDVTRSQQGREKRQRRGSEGPVAPSEASENAKDVMTSFKFPQESPARKSAPPSPAQRLALSTTERPFTLPGLSGINLGPSKESVLRTESPASEGLLNGEGDADGEDDADGDEKESVDVEHQLPIPLSMKARRAPIPLDFKHPVSTNTVPAGLFKALANGTSNNATAAAESEECPRRIVRSRLSSREIFEHVSRPSLDDLYVPAISQNIARGRLITDPSQRDGMLLEPPQTARDRRSSLPAMASSARSSFSDISVQPPNISHQLDLQLYEERLEALLESKLFDFREEVRALRLEAGANAGAASASTEAAINEVVSLFRTQLQESAARGLDDSQVDARGELDFQLVKDIVEQGHAEARAAIQQDLDRILHRVEALQSAEATPITGRNTEAMLEEYHARTRTTVVGAVAPITARLEALERTRTRTPLPPPQVETVNHEALVRELHAVLVPHIIAMRAEPIDYELLTEQLSQAVKPHISQLIDLASDKRETAGLIVDRLIPILPKLYPPAGNSIDIPVFVSQVTAEVRRIVAPLDTYEIKEQVSDLVVERLDSRLVMRDRVLDGLSSKLVDGLESILEPVNGIAARVAEVSEGQQALSLKTRDLASANNDVMTLISGLPGQLSDATELLRTMLADFISTGVTHVQGLPSSDDLLRIGTTVDGLSGGQQALQDKATDLLALYQNILSRLTDLPNIMAATVKDAQIAGAELLARTVTKEDFEEVRNMMSTNADLQVQLAKARAQHGAVRAEKDIVMERMTSAESECDQLRAKVDEIQAVMLLRATDAATSQARTTELEEALSQSLARLKTSDVTIESQQERLFELERLSKELTSEKQGFISKVHSLELQAGFASRDKEAAVEALAALRSEHETLMGQQTHWEDLRRTTEQLDHLSAFLTQVQTNEPELKELRRVRDRSKALEGEYAALQRRFKEQETRATSSDRAASAARASLGQAQQRAAEWEQRANEHMTALTDAQAALENAEEHAAQFGEELSLAKAQIEEKDAEERLAKDRESKLRDQLATLEARVAQLQTNALRSSKTSTTFVSSPPRPDSRTSSLYPSRTATPTASVDRWTTSSVRDSMHAPTVSGKKQGSVAKGRFVKQDWRVPSPTLSVVSVAPTPDNEGWYQ